MDETTPFTVEETAGFRAWRLGLRDRTARIAIARRIQRFGDGLLGDVKAVGGGVMEARVDFGPGYRMYYIRRDARLVLLLHGGDKGSQTRDIAQAQALAAEME